MTYYEILNITASADENEVKRAFRKLAMKYHPDVNTSPDASDRFKLVYIAYEILSDSYKRKMYDELLESKKQNAGYSNYGYSYQGSQAQNVADWDRTAHQRARAYSEMQYKDFKETLLDKISFQVNQALAFILFFALLSGGMVAIGFGWIEFNSQVNGAKSLGILAFIFGGTMTYFAMTALYNIIKIWRG